MHSSPLPLLEVKNLKVALKDKTLVSEATFKIYPQERIAIVGPSGSGKSLTLSAVAQLLPPRLPWHVSGNVFWEGEDFLNMDKNKVRLMRKGGIAFLPQEALCCLNPSIRIGKQIAEVAPQDDPAEWLAQVGIENSQKAQFAYPHEFSGGMCQRVVLAIALASKPKLLLADEFTSALDTVTQVQIIQLINRLCNHSGIALLTVTHDKRVAAKLCSKTLHMDQGKLSV